MSIINIENMSLEKLKALWYDEFKVYRLKEKNLEVIENRIKILESEIKKKDIQ